MKIRSVYDHIISLAHISDCLFDEIEHGIPATDVAKVAFCIAYHELNEVVLGDIPTYTSLNADRRNLARIFAEQKLRMVQPSARKQIANEFIWMFLSDKHRNAFKSTFKILSDEKDPIYMFFRALDKIDPVVAVWRYLHHYRGRLGSDPKDFNRHMKDFYENPDVRSFVEANKMDGRLIDFVLNLQDRGKAWDYYQDRSKVFGDGNLFQLPREVVCKTIEGVTLFEDAKSDDFPKRARGRNVSRDAYFRHEKGLRISERKGAT